MRKVEIHIFTGKTSGSRNYRLSFIGFVSFVVCFVLAVLGYLIFSPARVFENVSDGDLLGIYRENRAVKHEIRNIRASVDESILRAEETKGVRDSVVKLSGLGFTLEDVGSEFVQERPERKSLNEIEESMKKLLTAIESDSLLAARIPVIHPLKNGHAVRNRFEIIHDPFTDIDLPHRGIDYVAEVGDTVYATGSGVVSEVRSHRGFGLSIKLDHMPKVRTFYAHLGHALVQEGVWVRRGEPIAVVDESGRESGIGLHYEIRVDGTPVNPEDYFITK